MRRNPAREKLFLKSEEAKLRHLSHELSNALETVLQATYLLRQAELPGESRKWAAMVDSASQEAAQFNRQIRELLREKSGGIEGSRRKKQTKLALVPKPAQAEDKKTSASPLRRGRTASPRKS